MKSNRTVSSGPFISLDMNTYIYYNQTGWLYVQLHVPGILDVTIIQE